jgi:uncharacterized membrane protein YecN with MAPEG domain
MTIPTLAILAFAAWTVLLLFGSVGLYRWRRNLTGQASLTDFPADRPEGADRYRRAIRAHANCVENLPVLTAIVVAAVVVKAGGPALDALSVLVVVARIPQSLIQVALPETPWRVGIRFAFFLLQAPAMLAMAAIVVRHLV